MVSFSILPAYACVYWTDACVRSFSMKPWRERERETDRQTDRQTDRERDRDRQRQIHTERDRERAFASYFIASP